MQEGDMRTPAVISTLLLSAAIGLPQGRPFTGEIMDSQCAGMGSHARMMQGVEAKDVKECTRKCVEQLRGKYVLFDAATKTTYQLDNQGKAAAFAGQKVSVKGALDAASKTIRVESVEAQ
jgi:hypothetical protein